MILPIRIGVSLFLLSFATQAIAKYQNPEWIEVSPGGESFRVSLPYQPKAEAENVGAFSGNRYVASTGIATYTVWSLRYINYRSDQDTDLYLDATAELVWEDLLKSAREALDKNDRLKAHMSYVRELPRDGLPGREYTLTVGNVTGTTQLFVAHERAYVVLAMGVPGGDWPREKFFASFHPPSVAAPPAPTKPLEIGGAAPGTGESNPEDYNRVFSGKEVTQKARVLEKPEPTYTESARKFGVTGTIVLRCVFSKNGEVTNIHVVRKLPHGLTDKALAAARAIRFTPAMKDGQPVSMWMELQYNFFLY